MHDLIRRALEWGRLLLAPGAGNRRRAHRRPDARPRRCLHSTPLPPNLPLHRSPYGLVSPLDGTESLLVRPYLAAVQEMAA